MHKYLHHIGDFMRDTVHLTALEECFYRRAMDFYYLNEKPLPKETQMVFRRLRANTEDEKQAVLNVLEDFFTEEEDGFHNKRCDAEIAGYVQNANKNRVNGKKGGRPPKNKPNNNPNDSDSGEDENPEKTQSVNLGSESESQKNLNHKPLTDNQFNSGSSNAHEQKNPPPPIQFSQYQSEDHKRYTLLACANQYPIQNDFIELAQNRFENIPTQDLNTMFSGGGMFCDFFSARGNQSENTASLWLVKWFTWIENNKDQVKRNREKQNQAVKQPVFVNKAQQAQNEIDDWLSEINQDQPETDVRQVFESGAINYAS